MLEKIKQKITQNLDLKGLACPLPLLKMKLALKQLEPGQLIYVETTDSGSWTDFHKFTEITDNTLISADLVEQNADGEEKIIEYYQFVIKKGL